MIRFSASLVVVALGLLVAGGVTSKLLLVYVAIAVSAIALVFLIIGAILNRGELRTSSPAEAPGDRLDEASARRLDRAPADDREEAGPGRSDQAPAAWPDGRSLGCTAKLRWLGLMPHLPDGAARPRRPGRVRHPPDRAIKRSRPMQPPPISTFGRTLRPRPLHRQPGTAIGWPSGPSARPEDLDRAATAATVQGLRAPAVTVTGLRGLGFRGPRIAALGTP